MKRKITSLTTAIIVLFLMLFSMPSKAWGQTRTNTEETLVIKTYATANGWEDSKPYTSASTTNVTFTGSGTGNNCKYYQSGNGTWRYYSSGNGQITITSPSGSTLKKITLTTDGTQYFTTAPTGWSYSNKVFTANQNTNTNTVTIVNGSGTSKIEQIKVEYIPATPSITISPSSISKDHNAYNSSGYDANALTLTPTNISGNDPSVFSVVYCDTENGTYTSTKPAMMGETGAFVVYNSTAFKVGWNIEENESTSARDCYFKVKYSTDTYSNAVHVSQSGAPEPEYTVTLTGTEINATYAGGTDNSISVSTNLTGEVEYDVLYKQGNNEYLSTPNPYSSWLSATVTNNKLVCTIQPNSTGAEQTAMIKVYAMDDNFDEAYSEVVTITQTPVSAPELDPSGGTYHGTVYLTMTTETNGASIIIQLVMMFLIIQVHCIMHKTSLLLKKIHIMR